MWSIPGLSGMAILASERRARGACEPLRELLESIDGPAFLRAHCEAIEQARIDAELKRANIQRRLAETQLKQVMRSPEPRETVALHRRVRELTERVAELEEEDREERAALEEQLRVLEGDARGSGARAELRGTGRSAARSSVRRGDERGAAHGATTSGKAELDGATRRGEPDARPEREAWQTLLDQYLPILEGALPCEDERDPLSLPCPLDLRGLLREEGAEQRPGEPSVDVVVCVHDALAEVRECLHSLLAKSERPLRLILVDDGSGEPTARFLQRLRRPPPRRHADPPRGAPARLHAGGQPRDRGFARATTWCCSTATPSSPPAGWSASSPVASATRRWASSDRSQTPPPTSRCRW